jgi:hypothetical protein
MIIKASMLFNYIMYTFVYTYMVRWWKWLDAVGL